jgi:hypothetical protein
VAITNTTGSESSSLSNLTPRRRIGLLNAGISKGPLSNKTVNFWFRDHFSRAKRESLCAIPECPLCDQGSQFIASTIGQTLDYYGVTTETRKKCLKTADICVYLRQRGLKSSVWCLKNVKALGKYAIIPSVRD